jgi:hypothetical protein
MLEAKELKYIITTEDGKMISGYNSLKDAETDADDLCKDKKNKKFHIYQLTNSMSLADTVLQKTFELKTTYPLPEPEPEPEPKKEPEPKSAPEKEEEEKKKE